MNSLHIGDNLSASIDYGLANSDYGIVILSKNFFKKNWPQEELGALITKQVNLKKRIILPVWHKITKEEIQEYSSILTNRVAAKYSDGNIENIATKLYKEIQGISTVYNFSSDTKLKDEVSSLFNSVEKRESLLEDVKEELCLVTLTKVYLTAKGYRNTYISYWPFSELLSSNNKEREKLDKIINVLIDQKFVESKALGTISITHEGIKKIENLLEDADSKYASQIKNSISNTERSEILEIQSLRYKILELAHKDSNNEMKVLNLFRIGDPLGINREKLQRVYFYLQDEGLIDFYALGGDFLVTEKGKQLIEKKSR